MGIFYRHKYSSISRVFIRMKRNILWTLVANIAPIILMNIIGHASFFMKKGNFDTSITLVISTMLVLTTQ